MVKLQFIKSNNQYTITISSEHIKRMKWKKGDEIYVTKHPDGEFLYLEKMSKSIKNEHRKPYI